MTVAHASSQRKSTMSGVPGMAGWSALPTRDRRLLEWLWTGDVVTAELAALLAYGNLRVAQRRLSRLGDYGLIRGFWSANSQRPRGRYAYALTRAAHKELEYLIWKDAPPNPLPGRVNAPSPVIHQLATHDLLAAFLKASPLAAGVGLAAWTPDRAAALAFKGYLRPDAIAVFLADDRATLLMIERDLGTERRDILAKKVEHYSNPLNRAPGGNLGLVVESGRRSAAVRASLRPRLERLQDWRKEPPIPCWVAVSGELLADPFGAIWRSPDGGEATVLTMPPHELQHELPILSTPALLDDDAPEALDDRALEAIRWRP
jgi:hypothetical protein